MLPSAPLFQPYPFPPAKLGMLRGQWPFHPRVSPWFLREIRRWWRNWECPVKQMPIPVGEHFGERAGLKVLNFRLYCSNLAGIFHFTGLASVQKCETNATATHQFCITEPSIMNNWTWAHYWGLSTVRGSSSSSGRTLLANIKVWMVILWDLLSNLVYLDFNAGVGPLFTSMAENNQRKRLQVLLHVAWSWDNNWWCCNRGSTVYMTTAPTQFWHYSQG